MALKADMGKAQKLVESVLRDLKVDPEKNRVAAAEGGVAWAMARGSAALMIALNPGLPGTAGRVRMVSPIVRIQSDRRPELFQRLLELNATDLRGAAFGVVGSEIVLVAERSARGLDRSEVEDMLAALGDYADRYDDLLVKEFGGTRVCDLD